MTRESQIAVFGGGCFWCVEACYARLRGVISAESGYSGGHVDSPGYQLVCSGTTGHAEVVQVTFDPAQISYDSLLEVFFTIHDPTTLNRQGEDVGTQYRSAIFYADEAQRAASELAIARWADHFADPIVTQLAPLTRFWPAEDYHRAYFESHGHEPYCAYTVAPKVKKFVSRFAALLK